MHNILAATPNYIHIQQHNSELICAPSSRYLMENGEALVAQYYIPKNGTVIDVGANKGQWSSMAFSLSTPKVIHAFEPIPALNQLLKNNLSHMPLIAHELACSNRKGMRTFYYFTHKKRSSQMSSFYPRDIEHAPTPIHVQTITLDEFCITSNIPIIDFVKIDSEGAELEIIEGAQSLLARKAIRALQFEYENSFKPADITLESIYQLLREYEYAVYKILPNSLVQLEHWEAQFETFLYGNYLALPT